MFSDFKSHFIMDIPSFFPKKKPTSLSSEDVTLITSFLFEIIFLGFDYFMQRDTHMNVLVEKKVLVKIAVLEWVKGFVSDEKYKPFPYLEMMNCFTDQL